MKTVLLVLLLLVSTQVEAVPTYIAVVEQPQGVVIVTLTDEPCKQNEVVSNLKWRATWTENDNTHEGCYGSNKYGVLTYWFNDKTVAFLPLSWFVPATGV